MDASLQQRLVEQQRASRGAVLLQTEDEVPEVNSCDPLTELLTGGARRRRARTRAHLQGGDRTTVTPGDRDKGRSQKPLPVGDISTLVQQ